MKRYQQPEVFEALAAEYVLGTLQGKARQRFEALMQQHRFLQAVVADWERRLAPAVEFSTETVKPSQQVWQGIAQHIKQQEQQYGAGQTETAFVAENKASWRSSLLFWQGFGVATVFSVMMAMFVSFFVWPGLQQTNSVVERAEPKGFMANLKMMDTDDSDQQHAVAAIFEANPKEKRLYVNVVHQSDMPDNMSYHLWCLDYGATEPVPMGALADSGMTEMPFKPKTWENLQRIQKLMVTLEYKDQEPKTPSGKILFEGPMVPLMVRSF